LSVILCGILGFQYLKLRLRFKAVERETSEVSALRLELARMEEALAARTEEAEEGKRRLGETEEKLREILSRNVALDAQLKHRDRDIQRHEEELQQHAREHALTIQLVEARTLELRGAEALLTKADVLSGEDVIALVNTLNSEIYQTAVNVAEAFEFKPKEERTTRVEDVENLVEVYASATDMVGPQMVQMLGSLEHREDPTIVQIALQAAMVAYSNWIVRSWNLEDPEGDVGVNKVYKGIRDAGEAHGYFIVPSGYGLMLHA
ncbi:hypothetical protein C0991_007442, partial [Blastosporella zonata]